MVLILGLFNYLLSYLGVMPIDWLGDPKMAFISIIILDIWHLDSFLSNFVNYGH